MSAAIIDTVTLREIQQRGLRIYKEIKEICDKHGLRYFAVAGTAIGVVRHQGFIPWDDDIDIAMPRRDYEKFKQIVKDGGLLSDDLVLTDYSHNIDAPVVFEKVMEKKSCYSDLIALTNPDSCYGIFVDIMPLDGVPTNWLFYKLHWLKLCILLAIYNLIIKYEHNAQVESLSKKVFVNVAGVLSRLKVLSKRGLKQMYMNTVRKHDFDASDYSAYLWIFAVNAGVNNRARFRADDFKSHIDMPFEDTTMRMPKGYKNHLNTICPDHMTPPPKEKQTPKHTGILDLNKSYLEYANEAQRRRDEIGRHTD